MNRICLILFCCFNLGWSNVGHALPTTEALPPTTHLHPATSAAPATAQERRAARKAFRQELKTARKNARSSRHLTEERLSRRANTALLLSILSLFPLFLFISIPLSKRVAWEFIENPDYRKGYTQSRTARFITIVLSVLWGAYAALFLIFLVSVI